MDNTKQLTKSSERKIAQPVNTSVNWTRETLYKAIRMTAEACGTKLTTEAAILIVDDLKPYRDDQILAGLKRCREEIKPEKGFVTFNLAILIEKMGIPRGQDLENAEAQREWATVMDRFYLCNECPYFHGPMELSSFAGRLEPRGYAAL